MLVLSSELDVPVNIKQIFRIKGNIYLQNLFVFALINLKNIFYKHENYAYVNNSGNANLF